MNKAIALILSVLLLACCFSGCSAKPAETAKASLEVAPETSLEAESVELIVFAAASMTETLDEIIRLYKDAAPNVTVTPSYDSSGTLKTQIAEGADCDIFISAAQKQMNALDGTLKDDAEKNPDSLDLVDSATRVNLLENNVVLVVPEGNPAEIMSFSDILNAKLIALGNSDVPVGSYSLEILDFLGLDVKALEAAGKITYGSNVKEVTTQVSEAAVDCGIIYATDAFSEGLTVMDTATKDMCRRVIYPAAVLKASQNAAAAKAFLEYLQGDEAMTVFESVGFARAA